MFREPKKTQNLLKYWHHFNAKKIFRKKIVLDAKNFSKSVEILILLKCEKGFQKGKNVLGAKKAQNLLKF